MDCSCYILVRTGESPCFIHKKIDICEENIFCSECGDKISIGEEYEYQKIWIKNKRFPYVFTTCVDCLSIIKAFFVRYTFTMMIEEFYSHMNRCGWRVDEECLAKLTPRAMAKICERIEKEWERDDPLERWY